MYLKSIKLDGFKSFAEKTIFSLNKGITGIVGPNGSGKSNIVDAVRWVLGEQSVKSLRGGSAMSDVIFNGTETRAGLNKASVTLTFDNSDKFLNSEFPEIEVKRSVYKTGESEYFINNTKVRLKDIQDLFIDAGTNSFNIISQGTVQDIVSLKPSDRRYVIESAAGVLKYKKRKEEATRKLEKTKDNINAVNLVINELEETINPLKEQAEVAKQYLDYKEELKYNEIWLCKEDIGILNKDLNSLTKEEESLKTELEKLQKKSLSEETDKIKLDIYKVDDELNNQNKKVVALTEEISLLESEKRITIERTKYEYSEDNIKRNLINLKEEELQLIKDTQIKNEEIDELKTKIKEKEDTINDKSVSLNKINANKIINTDKLNNLLREKFNLENRIEILENNILNNSNLPLSVKNILNNPRLTSIHNTVGNVLEIPQDYRICTDVVLSASTNFLIVDNELASTNAIKYLQEQNIGRATFLPLNIIKSRKINDSIVERLKQINGYVGILSDLVKYDKIYQNIIENQLGNVIVTKDMDAMNLIAKIMEYKFRVVSLDGSIIHAGGSVSGGSAKKSGFNNIKEELKDKQSDLEEILYKVDKINLELKEINNEYEIVYKEIQNHKEELFKLTSVKDNKMGTLDELSNKLRTVKNDIAGINNLEQGELDNSLNNILEKLNILKIEKERIELNINDLKDRKEELSNKLKEEENIVRESNLLYKNTANRLNEVSLDLGKINGKLDNLLLVLNEEYGITYEYACANYDSDLAGDEVRKSVHKLKNKIKSLGEVNTGSIKEYERLSERYNFLTNQRQDLEVSVTSLLNIISEMDEIMKEKFKDTFGKVKEEFSKIFKVMFQGGVGKLELTDPSDYLNTGIDMIVVPPGKRIQNTQSLSGGEKSLTAICLLFAILEVSPMPFIVLDEVEAALDEVNVDLFGEYLDKRKLDSQYILITHKKRMMEYADVLYGITMQNAGISKVVGVKLENM